MEKYNLVGVDGNAFSIMGYVRNAMREEGKSKEEIAEYTKDATSSDYNYLLAVSVDMIDELNSQYDEMDDEMIEESIANKENGYQALHDERYGIQGMLKKCLINIWDEYGIEYSENEIRQDLHDAIDHFDFKTLHFYKYMPKDNKSDEFLNEGFDFPNFDDVDIEVKEDEPMVLNHLLSVEPEQTCLYMSDEELEAENIELAKVISILNKLNLQFCLCDGCLLVIIGKNDKFTFYKVFNKELENAFGVSVNDLMPYIYNSKEMEQIIRQ